MVKRILLSIVMLVLIAYLVVAVSAFNRKPADQTCRERYPSEKRHLPHREKDGTHLYQVIGTGTE